ncbi:MAG: (Fe-S)-binding protein [Dehalobacterium sp.]
MAKELTKKELQEKILKCNRCGMCQDVCPTFKVTGNEVDVARSRIRFARMVMEDKYNWGEEQEMTQYLKSCLLCKACVASCPSSVVTDEIMMQARHQTNLARGLPLFNRVAYRGVFSHNFRLNVLGKLLRFYQKSGTRWVVKNSGVLKLLRNLGKAEGLIPVIPKASLRKQFPRILHTVPDPVHKVAYYPGCAINVFYSEVGKASIEVLEKNHCQVEVPETVCCGGPHQSGGDFEEAKRLARKNIDSFEKLNIEAIITDCATCGSILKEYVDLLEHDPDYREKAGKFSVKVKDINEFLCEIGFSRVVGSLEAKVSYHDPCHLVRGQKITDPPREILQSISGLELREMKEADMCCGGAGSYGALYPEMSKKILERKINNFKDTGADFLVTSCPACMMQLEFGMREHGLKARVMHPVQLLAQAYRLIDKE